MTQAREAVLKNEIIPALNLNGVVSEKLEKDNSEE